MKADECYAIRATIDDEDHAPLFMPHRSCSPSKKCYPLIVLNRVSMYTHQVECVSQPPGFWSKINFSHKVRHRMKAEIIIFLLRYWAGVDSIVPPRTNGEKLSKVESLMDFGRWSSLPKIYPI